MKLENTYREIANNLKKLEKFAGIRSVGYRSPSNIALVKYWGKREVQLPQNPSLSFALTNSFTETVLRTTDRGEIMRWPIRTGRRQTL